MIMKKNQIDEEKIKRIEIETKLQGADTMAVGQKCDSYYEFRSTNGNCLLWRYVSLLHIMFRAWCTPCKFEQIS